MQLASVLSDLSPNECGWLSMLLLFCFRGSHVEFIFPCLEVAERLQAHLGNATEFLLQMVLWGRVRIRPVKFIFRKATEHLVQCSLSTILAFGDVEGMLRYVGFFNPRTAVFSQSSVLNLATKLRCIVHIFCSTSSLSKQQKIFAVAHLG